MTSLDEQLYEVAGGEIATKNVSRGLWARAYSDALGDAARTRAIYIRLRVVQLKEQFREQAKEQRRRAKSARRAPRIESVPCEEPGCSERATKTGHVLGRTFYCCAVGHNFSLATHVA
jgi:hypothetical protein